MNSADTGRLVALLGFDGAGKSSILRELATLGSPVSTWKMLRDVPQFAFMLEALQDPPRFREELPPRTRAAYLIIALFGEYEFLVEPHLRLGRSVFVESYYLRPIAKELVKGRADTSILLHAATRLRPPDVVVVVDVPLEIAFARGGSSLVSHDFDGERSFESYVRYQTAVLEQSLELAPSARLLRVDGTLSPPNLARTVLKAAGDT